MTEKPRCTKMVVKGGAERCSEERSQGRAGGRVEWVNSDRGRVE